MNAVEAGEAQPAARAGRGAVSAYFGLLKPRQTLMAMFAALWGFVLARPASLDADRLGHVLLGCFLAGGGAAALNQWLERGLDTRMKRTEGRPLPSGRLGGNEALAFGAAVAAAGVLYFGVTTNLLAAALAAAMIALYGFAYTPLKRVSAHSAWLGAAAGALPPVLGWSAAAGRLEAGAGVLFLVLFAWQFPHFLAIWRVHRDDYARAGFPTWASAGRSAREVAVKIFVFSAVLLAVSLLPTAVGMSGWIYGAWAAVSGAAFFGFAAFLLPGRLDAHAKRFVAASVFYLPALMLFMILDAFL